MKKKTYKSWTLLLTVSLLFVACKGSSGFEKNINEIYSFSDEKISLSLISEEKGDSEMITLYLNSKNGDPSVSSNEFRDETATNEKYNHSENKIAKWDGPCPLLCHLTMVDVASEGIENQHLVDYAGETYPDLLWSPNDRYLAYTSFGPYSFHKLSIFDTTNNKYGTGTYSEDGYYEFSGSSTSISKIISDLTGENPGEIDATRISWTDDNTLIVQTNILNYPNSSETIFWLYKADSKELEKISEVKSQKDWVIQDAAISNDLKTMAYIKTFDERALLNYEKKAVKQELWISNIDGSGAKMIYKNY